MGGKLVTYIVVAILAIALIYFVVMIFKSGQVNVARTPGSRTKTMEIKNISEPDKKPEVIEMQRVAPPTPQTISISIAETKPEPRMAPLEAASVSAESSRVRRERALAAREGLSSDDPRAAGVDSIRAIKERKAEEEAKNRRRR